jgi:hypothetical protein
MTTRRLLQALAIAPILGLSLTARAQMAPPPPPSTTMVALVVAEDGGLDPASIHSLVQIADNRLVADGFEVLERPGYLVGSQVAAAAHEAAAAGAQQFFVLHVLRLGQKRIFQLDERDMRSGGIIGTANLSGRVEDADVLLPRLVDAVVNHRPVEDTATVSTLSPEEARKYNYRAGTNHFVLGLPMGLTTIGNASFGLSLGYLYETEQWGLGFNSQFVLGSGSAFMLNLDIYGDYFFLPGFWSPYIGLGLGYMDIATPQPDGHTAGGAGAIPEFGVELFRLNHIRLRLALQALLPFYVEPEGSYMAALLLHIAVAF